MRSTILILTPAGGFVRIDCGNLSLIWEDNVTDQVVRQYTKKYLVDEGFFEEASSSLEHLPDLGTAELIEELDRLY